MELHERIFELALTRSFFYPANEPYGSTGGFYEYGPVGVLVKKKIEGLWGRMFLQEEGNYELETCILTPEIVLKASGHVQSFADPVVECKTCKSKVRADTLVEEHRREYKDKHGEKWDGQVAAATCTSEMQQQFGYGKLESLDTGIREHKINCTCGGEFGKAYMFNLMFRTGIGSEQHAAYCRPETAQGIFTAFPRVFRNHGMKLPIAIGQVGRSFRNEISPRKGLVRMREFTQMELEYFFNPSSALHPLFGPAAKEKIRMKVDGKVAERSITEVVEKKIAANEIMAYYLWKQWSFYLMCGIPREKMYLRVLNGEEVPHYSKGNIDMEVETSYGIIETTGNAYRTDFDLSRHAEYSKKDLSVFVEEEKKKIVPHVFELSMGVDRLFFCILEHCFREKSKEKEWEWFAFPPGIAPYHTAVFPLMKKNGLAEKARGIVAALRSEFDVYYYESGSIGKRYARADEIGIPYAITIDYDTLSDNTVTIRYRDDGRQERIKIEACAAKIRENIEKNRVRL